MSTMQIKVVAYVNVSEDNFFGYDPKHKLAEVGAFNVKALDADNAAERLWPVGNKMGSDLNGKVWPNDIRSLSVGDVVKVVLPNTYAFPGGKIIWLKCASVGWEEIPEPSHSRYVPLANNSATARQLIQTRYTGHPNSNVGDVVAVLNGKMKRTRCDQSLSTDENRRRSAERIAAGQGYAVIDGPTWISDTIAQFVATPAEFLETTD